MRVAVVEAQKVAALPKTCVSAVLAHAAPLCVYIGTRIKGTFQLSRTRACRMVKLQLTCAVWNAGGREGAAG